MGKFQRCKDNHDPGILCGALGDFNNFMCSFQQHKVTDGGFKWLIPLLLRQRWGIFVHISAGYYAQKGWIKYNRNGMSFSLHF